jgi:hypothetical protein
VAYRRKYSWLSDAVQIIAERLASPEPKGHQYTDYCEVKAKQELLEALFEGVIRAEGVRCYPADPPSHEPPSIEYNVWQEIDRNFWSHERCEATGCAYRIDTGLVYWSHNYIDYYNSDGDWAECMDHKIRGLNDDIDEAFPVVVPNAYEMSEASKEKAVYRTGAAGRPTSMYLAIREMHRRAAEGMLREKLSWEARELREWLQQTHPDAPVPKPKTLTNGLREDYNKLKITFTKKAPG